jgi:hypothetical protein
MKTMTAYVKANRKYNLWGAMQHTKGLCSHNGQRHARPCSKPVPCDAFYEQSQFNTIADAIQMPLIIHRTPDMGLLSPAMLSYAQVVQDSGSLGLMRDAKLGRIPFQSCLIVLFDTNGTKFLPQTAILRIIAVYKNVRWSYL